MNFVGHTIEPDGWFGRPTEVQLLLRLRHDHATYGASPIFHPLAMMVKMGWGVLGVAGRSATLEERNA